MAPVVAVRAHGRSLAQRRAAVDQLLLEINVEVAALPAPVLRAFVPVLHAAEQELSRDLASWLATVDGADRFTAQEYRRALVQLRAALARVRQLEPEMVRVLGVGGRHAGELATRHIARELAELSAYFEGTVRPIALQVSALVAHGEKLLIPRFRASAARYAGNVGDDIRHHLALGLVRGETIDQLTNRMVKLGGPRGMVALRGVAGEPGSYSEYIAEGLFRRYRGWAARIVRTEIVQPYNVTADLSLVEAHRIDSSVMRRWDAAIDRRICPWCRALDHQAVPIDQLFKATGGYGTIAHPTLHPN